MGGVHHWRSLPALTVAYSKSQWRGLLVFGLAVFLVAWAASYILGGGDGFALIVSDKLRGEEEAISSVARIFAALVLWLFAAEESGPRLSWVAAGLIVLGLGNLTFGALEPLFTGQATRFNETLFEGLVTRTVASALFAAGLVWPDPRRLTLRRAAIYFSAGAVLYFTVFEIFDVIQFVPRLTEVGSLERAAEIGAPLEWLTPWYWTLAMLPLALAVAASVGAVRHSARGLVPYWLLLAVVLFAGSLLHEYLWPSIYGSGVLTTADVLRLVSAVVLVVGGVVELKRISSERTLMLARERERTRRLSELAELKADFSAMVAHELDGPLSSINVCNEMLDLKGANPEVRGYATATIRGELTAMKDLVSDVRSVSAADRDDFSVFPAPMALGDLLADAESYARALPGKNPTMTRMDSGLEPGQRLLADPRRIGQVLRNLLNNASKHTPEGTPIRIRASRNGPRVRLEVADDGPGISSAEVDRIFEKYVRGSNVGGREVGGAGLGLYLSRRILQGHGSDLTVETRLGEGSVFAFELELET